MKMEQGIRLNRYLAMCGAGARRKVESLIAEGRVRVDGKVVLMPGYRVDDTIRVTVDGIPVAPEEKKYIVINKPSGWVCSVSDAFDPIIVDLLPETCRQYRLFPVGRLDRESEGLLILTNDGEFAQEILHPSKNILREYHVLLDREISRREIRLWMAGTELDGHFLKPLNVRVLEKEPGNRWVSVVIGEGIKREVRRMAQSIGFQVLMLVRKRIGKMELENLPKGEFIEFSRSELWGAIRSGRKI